MITLTPENLVNSLREKNKVRTEIGIFELKRRKSQLIPMDGVMKETRPYSYIAFRMSKRIKGLLHEQNDQALRSN